MRRTLSTPLTVFWKFVFPALIIGGFGYAFVMQGLQGFKDRDGTPSSAGAVLLGLVSYALLTMWLIWWARSLKRVEVDDRALYVSNYVTEIRIPLSEVAVVRESGSRRYFTLEVKLRNSSVFGEHITFRPQFRLYWSGLHPIVLELQALCERARAEILISRKTSAT